MVESTLHSTFYLEYKTKIANLFNIFRACLRMYRTWISA